MQVVTRGHLLRPRACPPSLPPPPYRRGFQRRDASSRPDDAGTAASAAGNAAVKRTRRTRSESDLIATDFAEFPRFQNEPRSQFYSPAYQLRLRTQPADQTHPPRLARSCICAGCSDALRDQR